MVQKFIKKGSATKRKTIANSHGKGDRVSKRGIARSPIH